MNFYKLLNKYKYHFLIVFVILITLVSLHSALLKDVVYESDDYFLHATRTANYYLALKQGQFPVRWGPNLNQSYGYPSFNYMYHTPYVTGAIIHSFGFSIQESLNLSVLIATVLGSVFAYFLADSYFKSAYFKSKLWSILLGLFYTLNPYTLLNIYWRGAVGEVFFYAFIPLFILSIKKKSFIFTSLITAVLVLSHVPSMLLLIPLLIVLYITEFKNTFSKKDIVNIIFAGITGLLLSSWYWVPAVFEQWMIEYQNGSSLTQYSSQYVSISSLFNITKHFNSSDNFLNVINIGGTSLFASLIGLFLFYFNKKVLFWLMLVLGSSFLLSEYSLFIWDNIKAFQYVQYPWRFTWLITVSSFMILILFVKEKKISCKLKRMAFVIVLFAIHSTSNTFITNKGIASRSDFDWYHPVSSTGSSFNEHNPIWSNMPYYFPNELMYVNASESSSITNQNKEDLINQLSDLNTKVIQFDGKTISYIVSPEQEVIALHKRLFYPGWEASLDGNKAEFISDLPEYEGILAIKIPAHKESKVIINFSGYTLVRRIAELASLTTLFILIVYKIIKR
jgi:hypothetical protein